MALPNPRVPWGKIGFATFGLIGVGYALMKATVPSEQQLYNSLSPDLRKQADAVRAARIARERGSSADAQQNAALTTLDPQKPNWTNRTS